MKSTRSDTVSASQASAPAGITHDQIADAAYMIWKNEGEGDPRDHWLRAEKQLRDRMKSTSPRSKAAPVQPGKKGSSRTVAATRGKRKIKKESQFQ